MGDRQRDRQHRPDTELDRTRGETAATLAVRAAQIMGDEDAAGWRLVCRALRVCRCRSPPQAELLAESYSCSTTRVAAPRAVRSSPSRADRAAVVGGATRDYACHPRPRDRSAEVTLPAGPRSAGRLPPCPGAHRRLRPDGHPARPCPAGVAWPPHGGVDDAPRAPWLPGPEESRRRCALMNRRAQLGAPPRSVCEQYDTRRRRPVTRRLGSTPRASLAEGRTRLVLSWRCVWFGPPAPAPRAASTRGRADDRSRRRGARPRTRRVRRRNGLSALHRSTMVRRRTRPAKARAPHSAALEGRPSRVLLARAVAVVEEALQFQLHDALAHVVP